MKPTSRFRRFLSGSSLVVPTALAVISIQSSNAASATWNGTTDATWATAGNWSASPVPGTADTATFNNAGGAVDIIDLGAGVTIKTLLFDTATAAAYTIGSGAVGSQTLNLNAAGAITMNSTVANNELINANLNLGSAAGAEAFTITNSKTATNSLTLAGGISTTLTGVKSLTVNSAGITNISGVISNGSGTLGLTKTGAGTLTLSGANSYSGNTTVTGILNAANSSALGTGSVAVNTGTGNQLQLASGVNVANALTINGGGITAQGALYVPTGSATYSGTINVTASPGAGAVFATSSNASTLTIAGNNTITSSVPVTVRLGTVVFSGSQSYTTGTTLGNSGAMIQFGKTTSMPASGTVSLVSGTTLAVNAGGAGEFTAGTTAGTIGGLLAGLGGQGAPVTLAAGSSVGVDTTNASGTVTQSSAWTPSVAVGLTKLGTGTLELSSGGTYAGAGGAGAFPLIVRQGTLLFSGGTNTVTGEAVVGGTFSTLTAGAGYDAKLQIDAGSLAVSGYLSVGRGNGIGGVSSDLVANNAATITSANFSAGYNGGAAGNLPKGAITLNNTSSYTIASGGVFNLAESPGSNITMTLNNTAGLSTLGVGGKYIGNAGTGVLTLNNASTAAFGTGATSGVGAGVMIGNSGGNGTLNLNGTSSASFGGLLTVGYNTGTGNLNLSGGTLTTTGELRVGGVDAFVGVANGSGTLTVSGGTANLGSLTLARGNDNADTVSGSGTISGSGVVNSAGDVVLGFAGNGNLGKLTVSGGTLNVGTSGLKWLILGQYDTSKGQLDITSGAVNLQNGSFIRMSSGNGVGTNVINQSGGAVTFYSDSGVTVGGTGALDLQQGGAAASNNTYNLNGGTLVVPQIISALNTGTRTFNFNGGTLKPTANTAAFLSLGTGNARANVRNGGALVDTNGFNATISQPLLHSNIGGDNAIDGGLAKSGTGILTLTGASTYTGPTSVSAGTLLVNGSLGDTAVSVESGATLGGTSGTIGATSASVNVKAGATLAPGSSIGTLSVNGGVTVSGTYAFEYDGSTTSGDVLNVNGTLTLNNTTLSLTDIGGDSYTPGDKFTLAAYGLLASGSTFSGYADDTLYTFNGGDWLLNYDDTTPGTNGGTGTNFITITAVPEPASLLIGSLSLLTLLRRRRK